MAKVCAFFFVASTFPMHDSWEFAHWICFSFNFFSILIECVESINIFWCDYLLVAVSHIHSIKKTISSFGENAIHTVTSRVLKSTSGSRCETAGSMQANCDNQVVIFVDSESSKAPGSSVCWWHQCILLTADELASAINWKTKQQVHKSWWNFGQQHLGRTNDADSWDNAHLNNDLWSVVCSWKPIVPDVWIARHSSKCSDLFKFSSFWVQPRQQRHSHSCLHLLTGMFALLHIVCACESLATGHCTKHFVCWSPRMSMDITNDTTSSTQTTHANNNSGPPCHLAC